jgi:hypothetical protein
MLLQKDRWVGVAITNARLAYETWAGLVNGKITIQPEEYPGQVSGRYLGLFANYAKAAFLAAVAVLHRGFFKMENRVLVKTKAANRMLEFVSEEQLDELLKWTAPLQHLRDKDQHRENPTHAEIWSVQLKPHRPLIASHQDGYIDPFPFYELLKSLEAKIGWIAFVRSEIEAMPKLPPCGP